jgi:hypothetical protein
VAYFFKCQCTIRMQATKSTLMCTVDDGDEKDKGERRGYKRARHCDHHAWDCNLELHAIPE